MTPVTAIYGQKDGLWRTFAGYQGSIEARVLDEVLPALRQVEEVVNRDRLHAVGFVSYEAASAFDEAFTAHTSGTLPLVWFGLYDTMTYQSLPECEGRFETGAWTPTVSLDHYADTLTRIKDYISSGDTYQVNYTYRLRAAFRGDPYAFFRDFVRRQPTTYGAYLDIGSQVICSASPELFFCLNNTTVTLRPMKGTIHRGCAAAEDRALAVTLYNSAKDRAENTMIVDMVRNDIGRIATPGSVSVPELFTIERYPTLWQMTSTVTAETDAPFSDIMDALFPGASITGAPKARTTEIITELESTPRQVYTGSIGWLSPGREAEFNIAIRTVLIDRDRETAEYGVGGGIVWDSEIDREYHETQVKARVLTDHRPALSLLETMRWTPSEGFFLLDRHLDRLGESASYFGYPFDRDRVAAMLDDSASGFDGAMRVRVLVATSGELTIEHTPLDTTPPAHPVRLRLTKSPINSENPLLYHKTTVRAVYEEARRGQPDCDDVILYNQRGEVTETTIANVVVMIDGELVTPPISCGLLAGTYRAELLDRGEITERVIMAEELSRCEAIYLINSVREWRTAELVGDLKTAIRMTAPARNTGTSQELP